MSRVDSKWEIVDYSYLTSSGSPARAAKILSPAVNDQLASSRVEFKWDEGSNASEYILNVGLNPGGGDFARGSVGRRTSAVVDNLPHATFDGRDAQLEAAIQELQALIAQDPRPIPPAPKHPDKRFPK